MANDKREGTGSSDRGIRVRVDKFWLKGSETTSDAAREDTTVVESPHNDEGQRGAALQRGRQLKHDVAAFERRALHEAAGEVERGDKQSATEPSTTASNNFSLAALTVAEAAPHFAAVWGLWVAAHHPLLRDMIVPRSMQLPNSPVPPNPMVTLPPTSRATQVSLMGKLSLRCARWLPKILKRTSAAKIAHTAVANELVAAVITSAKHPSWPLPMERGRLLEVKRAAVFGCAAVYGDVFHSGAMDTVRRCVAFTLKTRASRLKCVRKLPECNMDDSEEGPNAAVVGHAEMVLAARRATKLVAPTGKSPATYEFLPKNMVGLVEDGQVELVSTQRDPAMDIPAYTIFVDHAAKRIVLSFRGTLAEEDVIRDVASYPLLPVPLLRYGMNDAKRNATSGEVDVCVYGVPPGFLRPVEKVVPELMARLRSIFGELQERSVQRQLERLANGSAEQPAGEATAPYGLLVTGHSLGGAYATVFAALFRNYCLAGNMPENMAHLADAFAPELDYSALRVTRATQERLDNRGARRRELFDCVAFSPPPVFSSSTLASERPSSAESPSGILGDTITTVVHNCDVVPRLQTASVARIIKHELLGCEPRVTVHSATRTSEELREELCVVGDLIFSSSMGSNGNDDEASQRVVELRGTNYVRLGVGAVGGSEEQSNHNTPEYLRARLLRDVFVTDTWLSDHLPRHYL